MKYIPDNHIWACLFYTKNERITIQFAENVALISSVRKEEKQFTYLVGLIREGNVIFDSTYNGEVKALKQEIKELAEKLHVISRNNHQNSSSSITDEAFTN